MRFLNNKELVDVKSWLKQPSVCTSYQLDKSCKLSFTLRLNTSTIFRKFTVIFGDHHLFRQCKSLDTMLPCWWFHSFNLVLSFKKPIWALFLFLEVSKVDWKSIFTKYKNFPIVGGGEFSSSKFLKDLESCDILYQFSCLNTSE